MHFMNTYILAEVVLAIASVHAAHYDKTVQARYEGPRSSKVMRSLPSFSIRDVNASASTNTTAASINTTTTDCRSNSTAAFNTTLGINAGLNLTAIDNKNTTAAPNNSTVCSTYAASNATTTMTKQPVKKGRKAKGGRKKGKEDSEGEDKHAAATS